MKITKEYLRAIIKEELGKLEESKLSIAANNLLNKDTADRFNVPLGDKKIQPLQRFESDANAIAATAGTADSDVAEIIKRQSPEVQRAIIAALGPNPSKENIRNFLSKKGNIQ